MNERTKLGAAIIGGYILGRTKKGGAAVRMFMWATGNTGGPQAIGFAKENVAKVIASEQADAIVKQVQGPLRDAAQKAALAAVTARIDRIAGGLEDRATKLTSNLGETGADVAETATDTTKKTGGRLRGLLGGKGKKEAPEEEEPEDSAEEDEQDEPSEEKLLGDKGGQAEQDEADNDEEQGDEEGDEESPEGDEEGDEDRKDLRDEEPEPADEEPDEEWEEPPAPRRKAAAKAPSKKSAAKRSSDG